MFSGQCVVGRTCGQPLKQQRKISVKQQPKATGLHRGLQEIEAQRSKYRLSKVRPTKKAHRFSYGMGRDGGDLLQVL